MNSRKLSLLLDDDEEMILSILCAELVREEMKEMFKNRKEEGSFNILVDRYLMDDDTLFVTYFRLSPYLFQKVLSYIRPHIYSNSERLGGQKRSRLSAEQKLCVALRYLVSGDSQTSLQFDWRISQERISNILRQVFSAVRNHMMHLMPIPSKEMWVEHANNFHNKWNFPNVIGAIDGKHIRIQCPPNSGSLYFNYKGFFSTVLLAIVDADYKYIAIDVGSFGRESDGGIFCFANAYFK